MSFGLSYSSKEETYVMAVLKRGRSVRTAWIKKKKGVKVGAEVELKDLGEFWTVDALYAEMDGKKLSETQRANKQFGGSIK